MCFLLRFFFSLVLLYSFMLYEAFSSEITPIVDKPPKLHLCAAKDPDHILFFVEKYDRSSGNSLFENFELSADKVSKKWSCATSCFYENPIDILSVKTFSFPDPSYATLQTYLCDAGEESDFEKITAYNISECSSSSDFLDYLRRLPKFVDFDDDSNENSHSYYWKMVCKNKAIRTLSYCAVCGVTCYLVYTNFLC